MLANIISLFIAKKIYSYLPQRTKLMLFKYNLKIQKILRIYLIDYKIFSERYIEYDSNGKGREYESYNDMLIFEGDYLNGRRNGKGKEYYEINGKLKFEGEYLNGKRHGKGKKYYHNGQLKFEGEYFNGKKYNGCGYEIKTNKNK